MIAGTVYPAGYTADAAATAWAGPVDHVAAQHPDLALVAGPNGAPVQPTPRRAAP